MLGAGIHLEAASRMIRELLAEECELDGEKLQAIYRTTLGALS